MAGMAPRVVKDARQIKVEAGVMLFMDSISHPSQTVAAIPVDAIKIVMVDDPQK